MTTIACDGRSMAADGRTTSGGQVLNDETCKLHRLPDGRIFASTGPSDEAMQFERYMREEITDPQLGDDFSALVLSRDGLYWVGKTLQPVPYAVPQAIGSGGDIALGAMLTGKSPVEAVMIASTRDTRTGGTILSMELE